MTLIEAMEHAALFRPWFKHDQSWVAWKAFIASMFAYDMSPEQLAIFQECTGRTTPPSKPFTEAYVIAGRRGGKSVILAAIAVFQAMFNHSWGQHLVPGERATILLLSPDRKQSRTLFRYIEGMLEIPIFKQKGIVDRKTADSIDLRKRITIEVATASFRTTRGYTLACVLLDEVAFLRTEESSANPDVEILAALRPAMASMPGAMLLCASSPYARRGVLWDAYKRWHGQDDARALVWKAPTSRMNPSINQAIIDEAYANDHASASAEYGAEFRTDIAAFVTAEVVEACTAWGRFEIPRMASCVYQAFCDPSGGSSDSMALAICHRDGKTNVAILDCVREIKAPFSPDQATEELAETLREYGLRQVTGDKYAGDWPLDRFKAHGINYIASEKPKSDIYKELLPVLNARRVELLEHKRLHAQLLGLERRTARGGRDSIDHAPGAHDDVANAVAGAIVLCAKPSALEVWAKLGAGCPPMPEYAAFRRYSAPPSPQATAVPTPLATTPNPASSALGATAAPPSPSERDRAGLNIFGTS